MTALAAEYRGPVKYRRATAIYIAALRQGEGLRRVTAPGGYQAPQREF